MLAMLRYLQQTSVIMPLDSGSILNMHVLVVEMMYCRSIAKMRYLQYTIPCCAA